MPGTPRHTVVGEVLARAFDTRVEQLHGAPQKSSKTFPENWEHSTIQRKPFLKETIPLVTYIQTNKALDAHDNK